MLMWHLKNIAFGRRRGKKVGQQYFCFWSLLPALVHPVLAAKLIFTLHDSHPVSFLFGKSGMAPSGLQSEVCFSAYYLRFSVLFQPLLLLLHINTQDLSNAFEKGAFIFWIEQMGTVIEDWVRAFSGAGITGWCIICGKQQFLLTVWTKSSVMNSLATYRECLFWARPYAGLWGHKDDQTQVSIWGSS